MPEGVEIKPKVPRKDKEKIEHEMDSIEASTEQARKPAPGAARSKKRAAVPRTGRGRGGTRAEDADGSDRSSPLTDMSEEEKPSRDKLPNKRRRMGGDADGGGAAVSRSADEVRPPPPS